MKTEAGTTFRPGSHPQTAVVASVRSSAGSWCREIESPPRGILDFSPQSVGFLGGGVATRKCSLKSSLCVIRVFVEEIGEACFEPVWVGSPNPPKKRSNLGYLPARGRGNQPAAGYGNMLPPTACPIFTLTSRRPQTRGGDPARDADVRGMGPAPGPRRLVRPRSSVPYSRARKGFVTRSAGWHGVVPASRGSKCLSPERIDDARAIPPRSEA